MPVQQIASAASRKAFEQTVNRITGRLSKPLPFGKSTKRVSYSHLDAQVTMVAWRKYYPEHAAWAYALEKGPGPDVPVADKSGMVHAVYRNQFGSGTRYTSHCGKIYRRGKRRTMKSRTTEAPSCIRCLTDMR